MSDSIPPTELRRALRVLQRIVSRRASEGASEAYWKSKTGRKRSREFATLRGAQLILARGLHEYDCAVAEPILAYGTRSPRP